MRRYFLHVGLPKSASSYLQAALLPTLAGERVLVQEHAKIQRAFAMLRDVNPLYLPEAVARFAAALETLPAGDAVISSEKLLGSLLGGYGESTFLAPALRELCGPAKILVIVRRQDTYLESHYIQNLKNRYNRSFRYFVGHNGGFARAARGQGVHSVDATALDWSRVVAPFDEAFGRDRVTVLPYELLRHDPEAFRAAVFKFFEVDPRPVPDGLVNPRCSRVSFAFLRVANNLLRTEFNALGLPYDGARARVARRNGAAAGWGARTLEAVDPRRIARRIDRLLPSVARPMPDDMRAELLDLHRDANRRLGERCGLDLSPYGYY